jgi:hypothetical protein
VTAVHNGLRAWAKGMYHTEAAVELLIRGGFAQGGEPWIDVVDDTFARPNWDLLERELGVMSGGEQRYLRVALLLIEDELEPQGLDVDRVDLILAAIAHAAGMHQHPNATDLQRAALALLEDSSPS